jgi:hypothetical protein
MDMQNRKKDVFSINERPQSDGSMKSWFTKIGVAFVNRDGSYTIKLDALPVGGVLQVRDERTFTRPSPEPTTAPTTTTTRPHTTDIFGGS